MAPPAGVSFCVPNCFTMQASPIVDVLAVKQPRTGDLLLATLMWINDVTCLDVPLRQVSPFFPNFQRGGYDTPAASLFWNLSGTKIGWVCDFWLAMKFLMLDRARALLIMALLVMPHAARSDGASPIKVACHEEATKQYIADFRRFGLPRSVVGNDMTNGQVVVTSFVNDKSRYEIHYAECLARWNSKKARP